MLRRAFVLSSLIVGLLLSGLPVFAQIPAFEDDGFQKNRDYFGRLPYEHIDTLTGNLVLTFTDFVLPGNNGLDIRFQRTLNSKRRAHWTFGLAGVPMFIRDADSWIGGNPTPRPFSADGALHRSTPLDQNGDTVFVTSEYWRYSRSTYKVELRNGLVCEFGFLDSTGATTQLPKGRNIRYLTRVTDAFGNQLTFTYHIGVNAALLDEIDQNLGNAQVRTVTFAYLQERDLDYVEYFLDGHNHKWDYSYQTNSFGESVLTEVTPPEGPHWTYGYTGDDLTSMSTPNGGRITYSYILHTFSHPRPNGTDALVPSNVVSQRSVIGGHGLDAGEWTYTFSEVTSADKQTVVVGPTVAGVSVAGLTKTTTYGYVIKGDDWALQWKKVGVGTSVTEREDFDYKLVPFNNWQVNGIEGAPLMWKDDITRYKADSTPLQWHKLFEYHETTNYGDYGRSWRITETGDLTRTTTYTFEYDLLPYLSKTREEAVTVGSESFVKSAGIDHDTGFQESETVYGLTTTFEPDAQGNRLSSRDALKRKRDSHRITVEPC